MNVHYLEILNFLQELTLHPERLQDRVTPVFISEKRLHTEKTLNHRQNNAYIYDELFKSTADDDVTLPRIRAAAEHMTTKLADYKEDQLYWDPPKEQKEILSQLLPNNDICESILGLNDWLSSQIQNVNQTTKSTLVEIRL